jgi:hypothetical protein
LGVAVFSLAYPLVAACVLVRDWNSGVGEIYPIAPWALFCFVPNYEVDFGIRLLAINGSELKEQPYFEQLPNFSAVQKTVGSGIIHDMGVLASSDDGPRFETQRSLFERNFLSAVSQHVRYELVRREYDVLARWRTGAFHKIEPVTVLDYHADSQAP